MSDLEARPIAVHLSAAPPPAARGYPAEINLWFQTGTGRAFVACAHEWCEWTRGMAIKDVGPLADESRSEAVLPA